MTPQRSAVLVHGLPIPRQPPLTQLASVAAVCSSIGIKPYNFEWGTSELDDVQRIGNQTRLFGLRTVRDMLTSPNQSLVEEVARSFQQWIGGTVGRGQPSKDAELVLIGFSLGGAALGRWVQEVAPPSVLNRVESLIVIASPHTVPYPLVFRGGKTVFAVEPNLSQRRILRRLGSGSRARRLRVALSWMDVTAPPECGLYRLRKEYKQRMKDLQVVDSLVISDSGHDHVAGDPLLLETLRRWLTTSELLPEPVAS